MKALAFVLGLVSVTATLALAPGASADHLPCAYNTHGPQQRSEVVGVGPASVGHYTAPRDQGTRATSAEATCAARDCTPLMRDPATPEIGTPSATTPDVRALGETIVPAQRIEGVTLLGPQVIAGTLPAPDCVPSEDAGVFLRVSGLVNLSAGTDRIPIVTLPFLS